MKLTFLGTRGEIDRRTLRHRMHTSLMVSCRGADVMIDCGQDWLGKFEQLQFDAIVLTHAHPDHALGVAKRCALPVYASVERSSPIAVQRLSTAMDARLLRLVTMTGEGGVEVALAYDGMQLELHDKRSGVV